MSASLIPLAPKQIEPRKTIDKIDQKTDSATTRMDEEAKAAGHAKLRRPPIRGRF